MVKDFSASMNPCIRECNCTVDQPIMISSLHFSVRKPEKVWQNNLIQVPITRRSMEVLSHDLSMESLLYENRLL